MTSLREGAKTAGLTTPSRRGRATRTRSRSTILPRAMARMQPDCCFCALGVRYPHKLGEEASGPRLCRTCTAFKKNLDNASAGDDPWETGSSADTPPCQGIIRNHRAPY